MKCYLPSFLVVARRGGEEGAETLRCQRLLVFNKPSAHFDACLLPGLWLSPEDARFSGCSSSVHVGRRMLEKPWQVPAQQNPGGGGVQGAGEGEAEMLPQLVVSERRQPLRGPPAGDKERG